MVFLDGATCAHQGNARVVAEGAGRAIGFKIEPGHVSALPQSVTGRADVGSGYGNYEWAQEWPRSDDNRRGPAKRPATGGSSYRRLRARPAEGWVLCGWRGPLLSSGRGGMQALDPA